MEKEPKKKSKSLLERLEEGYERAAKSGYLGKKAQVSANHSSYKKSSGGKGS